MRPAVVAGIAAIALAAVGAGVYVFALGKADTRTGVVVDPETLDFGGIELGEQRDVEFTVENRGRTPAMLRDPVPNCACFLVTSRPSTSLRPGEKTTFRVHLEPSKAGVGIFHKEIVLIFSRNEGPGEIKIQLTGEVLDYYRLSAPKLEFGAVDAAKGAPSRKIDVRDGTGYAAKVVDAWTKDARFGVAVVPGDKSTDIVVTPLPSPSSPKGHVEVEVLVTIEASGHGRPPVQKTGAFLVSAEMR